MPDSSLRPGSLVLYKIRPALVTGVTDKIEIELEGGKTKRVRERDVELLHPGPTAGLKTLQTPAPNLEEAWELIEGEPVPLADLAELLYGEFTPATAWGTWELVADGLYFEGEPAAIQARAVDRVRAEKAEREAKAAAAREWDEFITRVEQAALESNDRKRLAEVERVALGTAEHSRILAHFGVPEQPEQAHRFLLRCGYWPGEHNPHPARVGAQLEPVDLAVPELPQESRRDLTHLEAFAIDDAGNQDPDDAISLDGERLWVHVADVAALVPGDSDLDLAARGRAANLYLPERIVGMLPEPVTRRLGLGLAEESPALSFGFRLGEQGVEEIEVVPSRIRVTRLAYEEVEQRLDEPRFAGLREITDRFRELRRARDAAEIDLPEVSTRIVEDEIVIRPLPRLGSRQMVTDAMLMAGEAAARFARANGIAIPHAVQPPPEEIRRPGTPSEMFAYRRLFKPSNASLQPEPHFGLGLELYARATSPLRRYQDLVVHQQLRLAAIGGEPASTERIAERIGASEAVSGLIRRAERLSNLHWKLVWLGRNPNWRGEAIVVALDERKATVIIPELAFETKLRRSDKMVLDQRLRLAVREIDLPGQAAFFRVLE